MRPTKEEGSGSVTLCGLGDLRGVPHEVVCILGLDDDVLRPTTTHPDDLLVRAPCAGDRDPPAVQTSTDRQWHRRLPQGLGSDGAEDWVIMAPPCRRCRWGGGPLSEAEWWRGRTQPLMAPPSAASAAATSPSLRDREVWGDCYPCCCKNRRLGECYFLRRAGGSNASRPARRGG